MKREVDERVSQPQRRQVIVAAASVAGMTLAMQLPAIAALTGESGSENELLSRLLEALGEDVNQVTINHAELDLHLTRILRTPVSMCESSTQELKQRLRENIEADYQAGELLVVEGLWLSATEAHCLELIEQVLTA